MATAEETRLHDILQDFDEAMLVTRTADGRMRSRPMALAKVEADGTLWFATDRHSGKIEEIARDSHVNVALQSTKRFVSISGTARPVEDSGKISQLWAESWKLWFPGGKDDPSLVLVEVRGESGEYWDYSGPRGIKYLIEAGKAYLRGDRPHVENDPKMHGKVAL